MAEIDERFRFRDDAEVRINDAGVVEITIIVLTYRFDTLTPGVVEAIRCLAAGTTSEDELAEAVTSLDGDLGVLGWKKTLVRFIQMGLIIRSLWSNGAEAIEMIPDAFPMMSDSIDVHPNTVISLSRFALLHLVDGALELQTPRSGWRVRLLNPELAAFVATLSEPRSLDEQVAGSLGRGGFDAEELAAFAGILARAGLLAAHVDADSPSAESTDPALRFWSFHDLLFHERSRVGRTRRPFGGTYPFVGTDVAPPPFERETSDGAIELPSPTAAMSDQRASAFFDVLDARQSIRDFDDDNPVTLGEISEVLWRAARVRGIEPNPYGDIIDRPYPSGGGMHELDIYVAVRLVDGLAPGLYRYDAIANTLVPVAEESANYWNWFHMVPAWPEPQTQPQALLVLSARFGRVMWKYESMAYALVLKDAGVLLQTLCLTTEALGLGGCALGAGDSEGFARVAGLNPYSETSVGEFALGRPSRPSTGISEGEG
jgi:SagB-type dehydrogenase family enzyme